MPNFIEEIVAADIKAKRIKKVAVRFPPEPNGYLHIGHAKAICLNYSLAKKFKGVFNLRFDDTNPAKEDTEYVDAITKDVKWLAKPTAIFYASDYFDKMYEIAVKLIKKGLAYVDDTSGDDIKKERGTLTVKGTDSKRRNRSVDENLKLFTDMKNGKFKDGEVVLRAKIDMASPNMNMRDPILYRVLHAHHYRTKNKWCIYPMYDFAHTIEDALEGITHSCCSLEFENHRPLYDWVAINGEFNPRPNQYEFARLNLRRTVMSKRYLKKLVDEKFVEGWDDPRMPTLCGLRRRGYTAKSIIDFCDRTGVSRANSLVEPAQLEACIREELNNTAHRVMAVLDPIELVILNRLDNFSEELNFEYPVKGENFSRKITFSNRVFIERDDYMDEPVKGYNRLSLNGLVRLKGAYIIECVKADKDASGKVIKLYANIIEGTKSGEVQEGAPKAKGVIHWVNAKDYVDFTARLYDYLLLDDVAPEADLKVRINPNSLQIKKGVAETYLKQAKKSQSFQFLRIAYFAKDTAKTKDLVFNRVVELKDNSKPK